jgi:prevent-host-death family protein
MDSVARTKTPVVVTKRKRPMVKIVPYADTSCADRSLEGSIVRERGSAFQTGEKWDADLCHGGELITKDRELHKYPHVQCLW